MRFSLKFRSFISGDRCFASAKKASLYDVLGVPSNSSMAHLRQAYLEAVKESHPDRNPNDPNLKEKFQKLSEAYETLGDQVSRKKYDKMNGFGNEWLENGWSQDMTFSNEARYEQFIKRKENAFGFSQQSKEEEKEKEFSGYSTGGKSEKEESTQREKEKEDFFDSIETGQWIWMGFIALGATGIFSFLAFFAKREAKNSVPDAAINKVLLRTGNGIIMTTLPLNPV